METEFFDPEVLKSINTEEYPIVKDYKDLQFHVKDVEKGRVVWFEINEQRLNSSEIKALLALNQQNNIFTKPDELLLNYLGHKLASIQTMYKIINDRQIILEYAKDISLPIYYGYERVTFIKEDRILDIHFRLDETNNIVLEMEEDEGALLKGFSDAYYYNNRRVFHLSDKIPLSFYEEIFAGKNKFSIDSFIELSKSILETLKEVHNVTIDKEIEGLVKMEVKEQVAPIVLEVGKTSHFITLELKYKVGEELFPINQYKYAQTSSWVDKEHVIRIMKEETGLVKYVSDLDMSDDIFDFMIQSVRIKINHNTSNPFQIMFPLTSLENVVRRVLPDIEKYYPVEFKEGQSLELNNEKIQFEIISKLEPRIDYFEFNVKFKVRDQYVGLDFLKNLMLQNRKYVQLSDGSTANIENIREINKWIEFLGRFEFRKSGEVYKTKSAAALQLDEFLKEIELKKVDSNEEYKQLIQELKERKPIQPIELPSEVDEILRPYQKEGVYWLYFLRKYKFGGILADEMGLGKTIQTLTLLKMVPGKAHLIVCPKSLIYNWENEIKKYFPSLKTLIIDKDSDKRKKLIQEANKYDIVITSYSMLQKDVEEYLLQDVSFEYLILDEAHYVKNMKTLSSKAVRSVPAEHTLLLTGTPLENNLEELYGTFELVMPGYLGSKSEFKKDFINKIERNNTIALEILQSKIRPFILRRTKSQVLKELPEKQEQVVYNQMTNKQTAIYREVLTRVKADVEQLVKEQGFEKSRLQILSALLKLRQVCNHPTLVDSSFENEPDISGKYEQFLELLTETVESGEKVLLFSQFTSMLDIFEEELDTLKIPYLRLDGSTKNRQEVVDKFNEDPSIKVFLISLKAGGVGLNLTSATAVFLYDPWWNPMAEQQAVDRAHRIGQEKTVNIYKFITKNSIEEKILKLQERKGNLFDNLIQEDVSFFKRLEWDDLVELFE